MMQLTGNKRTILKSRVRSHPDADAQRTALGLAATPVSNLHVPDLIQLATVLGLPCPSDAADAAYTAARAAGKNRATAMAEADAFDHNAHGPRTDLEDDSDESDDDDTTDADAATATPTTAPKAEAPKADPRADAIAAAVSAVLAPMGRGDMVGFQTALNSLATKATEPAPIPAPVAAYVDPAKIRGTIPQIKAGRVTMKAAGIDAPATANADAAALDQYNAIDAPAIDPAYVWPEGTAAAIAALGFGGNVFLWGPAGTGKTSFAKQLAARYGRPFARISCDDQTEATTLLGMTVPDGNGGVKWQDGQLAAACRRPGTIILIDEPTVARAGAHYVFNALLDDERAIVSQETGERITVAPGVVFIIADNTNGTGDETGAYEGTRRMSRALLDRFAVTIRLDYMPTAQEAQTIAKKTGLAPAHAMELAKFAKTTRLGADKGDVSNGLGIRRLFALGSLIRAGVAPTSAFQYSIIETAPAEDREPLRQLWTAQIRPDAFK